VKQHFASLLLVAACSGGCWGPPPNATPPAYAPDRPYKPVQIVAHRGANEYAPENTFAAARLCVEWGVDYIEVDVRQSSDGVFYLMHDANLRRTTDGSGWIRRRDSDYIDGLDAGSWFAPRFASEKVPRLGPFLDWARGKIKIYLDAKIDQNSIAALIDTVRQAGMEQEAFFWFGTDAKELEFRRLAPDLQLMTNAYSAQDVVRAHQRYQADLVETELPWITPQLVAACRRYDIRLMLVANHKDTAAYRRILLWGADLVNLNHADAFLAMQRNFFNRLDKNAVDTSGPRKQPIKSVE
jgi:glycerophosphoryl diester phosphodiesterase